jgi:hypothetical protein
MPERATRQVLIWSCVLILLGALSLLNLYITLSAWLWVVVLAAAGLGAYVLYLSDRSDKYVLLAAYVLWAIALLIALVTLNVLRGEAVAFFVLLVIALPFLALWRNNRAEWWWLVPAYTLAAVAVMIGLIGLGLLDDLLVPAYVMFAIAIPFFVVYLRNRAQWWWLVPAGIMTAIGVSFLIAEGALVYIGGAALIAAGVWLLARGFRSSEPRE